ncbi:DUF6284 family protein [Streptomyces bambusae]|uniref:Uncharacterized protein n=1 Tax=Streptomyces bambusae TaxID=1550616 RepID=A0ABS6ZAH5_9ACTN|nr:DUF6284 family protein [Streptomyces bambusae]MBW5484733.1 hypothetical protein [Streptomyces bambusae]
MKFIGAVQAVVTADEFDREPTDAELNAVEAEMPLILAQVDLLDVQIALLDRLPVSELDARRLRRARGRVLAERVALANRVIASGAPGVA